MYSRNYYKGLLASVFLLVFLPERLTIDLGIILPSLTIHRLIIAVMLIHWIRNKKLIKTPGSIPFLKLQILIAVCFLVPTVFSDEFSIRFRRFGYYIFEYTIFFWMIQASLRQREQLDPLIKTLVLSLLAVAGMGILEHYTGFNINSYLPMKSDYNLTSFSSRSDFSWGSGVASTYNHRILFGVACAGCTILCFTRATLASKRKYKVAYWVACIVGFASLYFSNSRGPWVAFLVTVGFLCVVYSKRFLVTTAILTLIVISIFVFNPNVWVSIQEMHAETFDETHPKGGSYNWRYQVWGTAWDRVISSDPIHMLFGYGGGSHILIDVGEMTLTTGYTVKIESWDCQFAIDLFEHGLLGFSLMLWMLFYVNFSSLKYIKRRGPYIQETLCATGSLVVLIFSKISVSFFAPQLIYLEAIALAVISRVLVTPTSAKTFTTIKP